MSVEKPEEKKSFDWSQIQMDPTLNQRRYYSAQFGHYSYGGFGSPDGPTYRPEPVRPNVRAALDYLDNIFARGGDDAVELWDVLTALRGPDAMSAHEEKALVTIPIRIAALPKTAKIIQESAFHNRFDNLVAKRASFGSRERTYPYRGERVFNPHKHNHFHGHGFRAAVALGLV